MISGYFEYIEYEFTLFLSYQNSNGNSIEWLPFISFGTPCNTYYSYLYDCCFKPVSFIDSKTIVISKIKVDFGF